MAKGGESCMANEGMHGRGHVWQGGMHGGWVCMAGGACMAGRHAWQGVCVVGGSCVAGETATEADGTHPTGMHSCFK